MLVCNAGSSSLKFSLFDAEGERLLTEGGIDWTPLHNPASLDGMNAVVQVLLRVPQVAVFDKAFHATLSAAARTCPVPQ